MRFFWENSSTEYVSISRNADEASRKNFSIAPDFFFLTELPILMGMIILDIERPSLTVQLATSSQNESVCI